MLTKFLLLIALALLLASCATLLNPRNTEVRIRTFGPASVVVRGDTIATQERYFSNFSWKKNNYYAFVHQAAFFVPRAKTPLEVRVFNDSTERQVVLNPRLTGIYWANLATFGLGMLVDRTNPKRFRYPGFSIDLENPAAEPRFGNLSAYRTPFRSAEASRIQATDRSANVAYDRATRKGMTYLTLTFPHFNWHKTYIDRIGMHRTRGGFWGIGFGVDHHYSDTHSLAFEANAITSEILIVYLTLNFPTERHYRFNFSLTDNWHRQRFSLGYGINVSRNFWSHYYDEEDDDDYISTLVTESFSQAYWTVGPMVNAYLKLHPSARLGLVYRPSVYRFGRPDPWRYEHSVSVEMKLNIGLRKNR